MQVKDFVSKAIEGGWEYRMSRSTNYLFEFNDVLRIQSDHNFPIDEAIFDVTNEGKVGRFVERIKVSVRDILLDPKAWEAVAEVMRYDDYNWKDEGLEKQLQFIRNLQQGQSIEEALTNVMK